MKIYKKVGLLGKHTHFVSLPIKFIRDNNIKKGDFMYVDIEGKNITYIIDEREHHFKEDKACELLLDIRDKLIADGVLTAEEEDNIIIDLFNKKSKEFNLQKYELEKKRYALSIQIEDLKEEY